MKGRQLSHERIVMETEAIKGSVLTKSALNKMRGYEPRTATVEVPELNKLMDLEEGQNAIMVVRQLDLSELVKINQDGTDFIKNLMDGIVEAAASKAGVKDEVEKAMSAKGAEWSRRIDMVQTCLIEPKLTRGEVIKISELFPSVILRLFTTIMDITNRGADIKKNSSK
jgi:hypothetical protein